MVLADAMQAPDALLLGGLHRHRADVGTAVGFEQASGIGAVGLVATDIGPHAMRREQDDRMPETRKAPRPMMGGATRFHDHTQRRAIVEAARKRPASQALAGDDPMLAIGKGEFEDILGEIDGDDARGGFPRRVVGASVLGGLLS